MRQTALKTFCCLDYSCSWYNEQYVEKWTGGSKSGENDTSGWSLRCNSPFLHTLPWSKRKRKQKMRLVVDLKNGWYSISFIGPGNPHGHQEKMQNTTQMVTFLPSLCLPKMIQIKLFNLNSITLPINLQEPASEFRFTLLTPVQLHYIPILHSFTVDTKMFIGVKE